MEEVSVKREFMEFLKRRLEKELKEKELKEKELAALLTKHVSLQKIANRVFKSYCNIKKQHQTMKKELKKIQDFYHNNYGLFTDKLRQDQLKALCSNV